MDASPMDIDATGKEGLGSTSDKLQTSLSDVVDIVGLFADLTSELAKGKKCDGQAVEEACKNCVQKIKDMRSALRDVVPNHMSSNTGSRGASTASYNSANTKMDSYLEYAQASTALDKIKVCKEHLKAMKKTLHQ